MKYETEKTKKVFSCQKNFEEIFMKGIKSLGTYVEPITSYMFNLEENGYMKWVVVGVVILTLYVLFKGGL